jgi:hypothetical protein
VNLKDAIVNDIVEMVMKVVRRVVTGKFGIQEPNPKKESLNSHLPENLLTNLSIMEIYISHGALYHKSLMFHRYHTIHFYFVIMSKPYQFKFL